MKSSRPCPICRESGAASILRIELPVNCSTLFHSEDEARRAKRGVVDLAFCQRCGMIFNAVFDAALLDYDGHYENSLSFSPAFRRYSAELIHRLIESYDLREKTVIEVGCGDGEFLGQLCESGHNNGVGFDPAFTGNAPSPSVKIFPVAYSSEHRSLRADAVCCRHVLEHIPDPCGFLQSISENIRESPRSIFYCETPNAAAVLTGSSLWDVIYPHCSYFTPVSLKRALEQTGFEVLRIAPSFDNQFLGIDAIHNQSRLCPPADSIELQELKMLSEAVNLFADRFRKAMAMWAGMIEKTVLKGGRIALWGAGAKAVTFLNMVPGAARIGAVVDLNPRKQGSYIPCTAQIIASPAILADYRPDAVILLNSAYESEVREELAQIAPGVALWLSQDGFPAPVEQLVEA
jgi:SAM-dependent methyltransferase